MFDIGSNSVRFVAYDGPPRAPMPIYNEKWPISLGKIVRQHGTIDDASMAHLLSGIDRFLALTKYMQISDIKAVATAAIRDARNGQGFITAAALRGLNIEMLDGMDEAEAAGQGILCNHPDADGFVADLGGGSLEVARIKNGDVSHMLSLPFGTSKLLDMEADDWAGVEESIRDALAKISFSLEPDLPLFMVGGTWRAIAHLHQRITHYPIDILSHYRIDPDALADLLEYCNDPEEIASASVISSQRIPLVPCAARMLAMLHKIFRPQCFISSPLGIREGLLFGQLNKKQRDIDPLLAATRFSGQRLGRQHFQGDQLFEWMQPLFADLDEADDMRLRHAACLLADCAWNIHPDYRSAHALQIGIEGNWLGVDGAGRALIARALWSAYGDSNNDRALLSQLAKRKPLRRADKWGLAIRLGMRIDGGTGAVLKDCQIENNGDELLLRLPTGMRGDTMSYRLKKLANAMGLVPKLLD